MLHFDTLFSHVSKVTRTPDCHTPMSRCIWLQKVISSPLADHLPTARSRVRWPQGKSRPRSSPRAGRSERKGISPWNTQIGHSKHSQR